VVAVPLGTTRTAAAAGSTRRAASLGTIAVFAALLVAPLAGCGAPMGTGAAAAKCVDLDEDVVQIAWSQTGAFVAIGTVDGAGKPWVRSLRIDDPDFENGSAAHFEAGMRAETVVVDAAGRLAWIAASDLGPQLVEAGPGRSTRLPPGVASISWTAIGYALLEHPEDGGSRVLNLDPDRPDEPTVSYATDLFVERLWISADPETMVLTVTHPDHRDVPPTFEVVGATATTHLEPAGADASGASMPALRRWVVYRSAATSRMEAVKVADAGVSVVLSERPALRGMVSDRGILAFVPVEPHGQLCLVDVAAKLP
jgi:hypothetical protein